MSIIGAIISVDDLRNAMEFPDWWGTVRTERPEQYVVSWKPGIFPMICSERKAIALVVGAGWVYK